MPHLAPLWWLWMPMFMTLIIFYQAIVLYFKRPHSFSKPPQKKYSFTVWTWD